MKIHEAKVGMKVKSNQNPSAPHYIITAINSNCTVDVEHRDGTMIMQGGKMVPEVFTYEQVDISILDSLMNSVVIFEDCGAETEQWEEFNESAIKQYVDFDERTSEGDDQNTTVEWINDDIAHVSFCEGPHFIFIRQ